MHRQAVRAWCSATRHFPVTRSVSYHFSNFHRTPSLPCVRGGAPQGRRGCPTGMHRQAIRARCGGFRLCPVIRSVSFLHKASLKNRCQTKLRRGPGGGLGGGRLEAEVKRNDFDTVPIGSHGQCLPQAGSFVSFLPEQERHPPEAAAQTTLRNITITLKKGPL